MARNTGIAGLLLAGVLLGACAGGPVSPAAPAAPGADLAHCPANEQWVCTGRSPSRIKNRDGDDLYCSCERIDRIR